MANKGGKKKVKRVPVETLTDAELKAQRLQELADAESAAVAQLARTRQQKRELGLEGAPDDGEEAELPASIGDPRIQQLVDELDDGSKFWVYRETGNKRLQVGGFPISEWPDKMESIAHECGGGDFLVAFREADGQLAAKRVLSFDPQFYKKQNAEAQAPTADSGLASVLAKMHEMQMQQNQAMQAQTMEFMKMLLAMNKPTSFIGGMGDLEAARKLFSNGEKSGGIKETLEMFKLFRDLQEDMSGGGAPGESGLMRLGTKLIETLGAPIAAQMTAALNAAQQPPKRAALPHAGKDPDTLTPQAPTASPEKENPMLTQLKPYLPFLVEAAMTKVDPAAYAAQLMEMLPERYDDELLALVSRVDIVDFLATFEPRVKENASWFWNLAQAVKDEFEDEPEAAGAPRVAVSIPQANGSAAPAAPAR